MPYEVRVNGRTVAVHEKQPEAEAHVRELVRADANLEPEILDTETGRPAEPAATVEGREDLAKKIGY